MADDGMRLCTRCRRWLPIEAMAPDGRICDRCLDEMEAKVRMHLRKARRCDAIYTRTDMIIVGFAYLIIGTIGGIVLMLRNHFNQSRPLFERAIGRGVARSVMLLETTPLHPGDHHDGLRRPDGRGMQTHRRRIWNGLCPSRYRGQAGRTARPEMGHPPGGCQGRAPVGGR